ncbi:MAG: ABC transporter permease subunit [Candidatus Actinomarina sp.]|nr:ABC transporter permease subunit [Candidatus Actinomarina sp.]
MIKFLIKELTSSLFSVFIFLFLMFYVINIFIPGDFLTPLRIMITQEELDALRASLGADDPLYQQYFRWVISVLSGEITPGGFRRSSSEAITSTIIPTLQVLLPSLLLAYSLSKLPALKTSIGRLYKDKIFSDVTATMLISLFPPIVYFFAGDRVEGYYQQLSTNLEFKKIPASLVELTSLQLDMFLFLFLLGLILLFISFIELATFSFVPKIKLLIGAALIVFLYLYLEQLYFLQIFFETKVAIKTITVLSVFLLGEYILMNNVVVQNISREPHILTARAIGYSRRQIYTNHILRNSFGPIAYRLGMNIPYLIASLVIVESTTNWGGMGSLLYATITNQDSNAAMGILFLLALLATFFRIFISIAHKLIDPRLSNNV